METRRGRHHRRGELDGAVALAPPRFRRGNEDEEGSTTVPFPQRRRLDDEHGGGAMASNFRPWGRVLPVQKVQKRKKEKKQKKEEKRGERRRQGGREKGLGFEGSGAGLRGGESKGSRWVPWWLCHDVCKELMFLA